MGSRGLYTAQSCLKARGPISPLTTPLPVHKCAQNTSPPSVYTLAPQHTQTPLNADTHPECAGMPPVTAETGPTPYSRSLWTHSFLLRHMDWHHYSKTEDRPFT